MYIGPNSRTERPRKSKTGTEVAHVTRDSDTTFKVKRSKIKVIRPLWLIVLAGQHGHTVMVTYIHMRTCHHLQVWAEHIVAAARLQLVTFAMRSCYLSALVSLFVSRTTQKTTHPIFAKNGGNGAYLPRKKPLNSGGNPNDITLGSGPSRVRLMVTRL